MYPFVIADDLLQRVVADLYVSYDDPVCSFQPPFSLDWAIGLGTAPTPPELLPLQPIPTHPIDLRIRDAADRTVFDTRTATSYHVQPWGTHLQVVQWVANGNVARLAYFTAFPTETDYEDVPLFFKPSQSVLQPRTTQRNMPKLNSVRVGLQKLSETPIELIAGYNMRLEVRNPTAVDGQRRRTQIAVHGEPGAGLGRYSNCDDVDPPIRSIGGQAANPAGDFTLTGDGCYRVNVPILGTVGDVVTIVPHALEINQHCQPCRSCDDLIAAYGSLTRTWEANDAVLTTLYGVRDDLSAAITLWDAQKACREGRPISIAAIATCPCLVSVAIGFCNAGPKINDLSLAINFNSAATAPSGGAVLCGSSVKNSGDRGGGFTTAQIPGVWPNYTAFWPCVAAGGSATLKMNLQFASCASLQPLTITVSGSTSAGVTYSPVSYTVQLIAPGSDGSCGSCQ